MSMFSTKYPNNSRTVTGTPQLYNDDVVLLCDTTLGPVTINLLEIPTKRTPAVGFWNTLWKLYIVDSAGNANTNNITINAFAGSTINGTATFTMNVDNECAVVRIVGDTQYLCSSSNAGGGGSVGYQTIENKGIPLPQRTILNFKGNGVTASDNNPKTDVEIPGVSVIDITNANLIAQMNASTLYEGWQYRVTDTQYADNIIVTATSSSKISLEGAGTFFNADYQNVGDYSGVSPAFVAAKGLWNSTLVLVAGDVVIWNNNNYVNTTGTNTAVDPAIDTTNFTVLTRQINHGYIQEVDFVLYNVTLNVPIERRDKRLNVVQFYAPKGIISYDNFPFGNDVVTNNICITQHTSFQNMMNIGVSSKIKDNFIYGAILFSPQVNYEFEENIIDSTGLAEVQSIITSPPYKFFDNEIQGTLSVTHSLGTGSILVQRNVVKVDSSLSVDGTAGSNNIRVQSNFIHSGGRLVINSCDATLTARTISSNTIATVQVTMSTVTETIESNDLTGTHVINLGNFTDALTQGFQRSTLNNKTSNIPFVLDMSDPAIFSGTTLTLPLITWPGIFLLNNPGGNTIGNILNGLTDMVRTFRSNTNGQFFRLTTTPISGATGGQVINNASTITNITYNGYNPELGESFTAVRVPSATTQVFYILSKQQWT